VRLSAVVRMRDARAARHGLERAVLSHEDEAPTVAVTVV
jgi:hypothetical protein